MLSAYREVSRRRQGVRARGGGGSSRASFILDVLSATCVAMNEVIPEAWIKHMGYNLSHCQGPVPTLSKLGGDPASSMLGVRAFGREDVALWEAAEVQALVRRRGRATARFASGRGLHRVGR